MDFRYCNYLYLHILQSSLSICLNIIVSKTDSSKHFIQVSKKYNHIDIYQCLLPCLMLPPHPPSTQYYYQSISNNAQISLIGWVWRKKQYERKEGGGSEGGGRYRSLYYQLDIMDSIQNRNRKMKHGKKSKCSAFPGRV